MVRVKKTDDPAVQEEQVKRPNLFPEQPEKVNENEFGVTVFHSYCVQKFEKTSKDDCVRSS